MKRTRSRVWRWTPLVALFVVAATLGAASGTEAQISTITFASFGDFGEDDTEHDEVAAMINSWSPDFIITQGDNRYDDENPTFDDIVGQRYCDYLAGVQSGPYCDGGTATENRFFPSTGNHDYLDGGGIGEYLEYFDLPGNELYYDFVKGPVHFFVMDSGPTGSFDATQQNWVQSGLQSSTAPWQVVSFHHAPYSSGEDHGSTANTQIDFAAWGADAVIAAHDHTYERLENDGIVYFVNGLGGRSQDNFGPTVAGSQFRYNDAYGAMRVTASLSSMILEFWAVVAGEAQLIDSHT
ncbi:MAG: alkaline phosphatase, partial [bacterium]|nr:alkaline phosphatase [bacterium]